MGRYTEDPETGEPILHGDPVGWVITVVLSAATLVALAALTNDFIRHVLSGDWP